MTAEIIPINTPTGVKRKARPYRIWFVGGRAWQRDHAVTDELDVVLKIAATIHPKRELVLVSGNRPTGAEVFAEDWARRNSVRVESYPAPYRDLDDPELAEETRDAHIISSAKPDFCLAFLPTREPQVIAAAARAEAAGIPTHRRWM